MRRDITILELQSILPRGYGVRNACRKGMQYVLTHHGQPVRH